jgi:cardiolipin synthase
VNIPNLITLARLLSVPILVWSIVDGQMVFAFLVFIAAGASDALDGFIAKRFGAETELGRFLDPLADKALLVGIYLALWSQEYLPNWLVLLVVWRDLLIVGGALLYQLLTRNLKMEPLLISKLNTLMQILLAAFILGMSALDMENVLVLEFLIWAVALTTVLSGATYVVGWVRKAAMMEGNP